MCNYLKRALFEFRRIDLSQNLDNNRATTFTASLFQRKPIIPDGEIKHISQKMRKNKIQIDVV